MKQLSTLKWLEYREYTIDRIQNATVQWEPYWHVHLQDVYHPELFEYINMEWPDFDSVLGVHDNGGELNPNRRYVIPNRDDLPFWKQFNDNIIEHADVVDAVYELEQLNRAHCTWVTASIWEDYRGYGIGNHYDAHTIDVAWQTYIYCDGGEHWGTSLNNEAGEEQKRIPFVPNSGWIMNVDCYSWHSADTIECDMRRSVMVRFMTKVRNQ